MIFSAMARRHRLLLDRARVANYLIKTLVFLLFLSAQSFADSATLLHVAVPISHIDTLSNSRNLFYRSVNDDTCVSVARSSFLEAKESGADAALVNMYLATLTSLEAKHSLWPIKKFTLANQAIERMNEIVKTNPNHFEIRFLRASTFYYLPFFFNQAETADMDVHWLAENFKHQAGTLDAAILKNVGNFLIDSGSLTDQEKIELKKDVASFGYD